MAALTNGKAESYSDAKKAAFDSAVSTVRWTATNGLRMFLQYKYLRTPMFWIPQGWVPYYAEWLLSFPKAPLGSISINVWTLACTAAISLVSDALVAVVVGASSSPRPVKVSEAKDK